MRKFVNFIFAGIFMLLVATPVVVATPMVAVAQPASTATANCEAGFLGIPPWQRGLTNPNSNNNYSCSIVSPTTVGGLSNFIWRIVLNIIEIVLFLTAYVAIFFILYGGFLFMTGGGNPAQVEKGRKSIFNAVAGLVISMGAIGITKFIFGIIGTTAPGANGIVQLTGEELLRNGLNLAYFIAGTVSVIIIVIAGIMYTTSGGDTSRVTRAKNMLLYSIVGLIVVLAAFAITNFVIGRFG